MNNFFGWNFNKGSATFQTNINGHCVSLHGDNSCGGDDCQLTRFSLAVFMEEERRVNITAQVFTNTDQWIDEAGREVFGTVENFITAVEWCKNH